MAKVLVTSRTFGRVVHSGVELLKEHGFNICYIDPKERPLSEEKMARIVAEQNPIAIICGTEPITPRVLGASKDLRIVMKRGVGLDNIDLSAATELGIAVGYVPEANKEAVADLTVALILMLVRDLWRAIKTTKSGLWLPFIGHELRAITVGVVGTGNIGTAVIQRLHGFRPRLLAYDLNPKSELMENYGVQYTSLEALLRESDVVTLHVPLTAQTKGMIGRRELD
ncbi:MAG: NAD(P)-dependent oxidoreductase, partial [Candidatus Bathyarchaeia archaeon]